MTMHAHVTHWTTMTWGAMLEMARTPDKIASIDKSRLHVALSKLRRLNDYEKVKSTAVTGRITQGWTDLDLPSPIFQDSYNRVRETYPGDWTPGDYLIDFAARCKASHRRPPYDLGRAIRNLPSFIRETSLLEQCAARGIVASTPSLAENVSGHADLHLTVAGRCIAVWSFLDTQKAWRAVAAKLRSRGSALSGLHMLAPVDMETDVDDVSGWLLTKPEYAAQLSTNAGTLEPLDRERTLALLRLERDLVSQRFLMLDGPTVNLFRK